MPQFPHLQKRGKGLGPLLSATQALRVTPGDPVAMPGSCPVSFLQKMGMSEEDKRNCCLLEIQETEAKYYRTLEDIEKVGAGPRPLRAPPVPWGVAATRHPLPPAPHTGCGLQLTSVLVDCHPRPRPHLPALGPHPDPGPSWACLGSAFPSKLGIVMASAPHGTGLSS